jgi:hypothetical protein
MRKILLTLFVAVAASLFAERAFAEAWVAKMFSEQSHDFGNVARGSDTVYRFAAKNIYKEDVELVSVRSSCGCTSPSIEKKVLKTGEIGYVTAVFNTRTFTGLHGATLTVEVRWNHKGLKRRAETQLRVNGNIRGDVVFKPGAVKFDNVDQGKVSEQVVQVTYDGRSSWKIVDVRGVSTDLEVELTQKRRSAGRVMYDLLVRLKDSASAGYFNEQLVLVTNDEQYPRIPMHIAGRVVPEISVAPAPLMLGEVEQGGQVSKKVLVRGKKPFRITSINSDAEDCFAFKTDNEAAPRHFVEVVFDAKKQPGQVKQTIHIATDLGETYNAKLDTFATILPSAVVPVAAAPPTAVKVEAGTASAAGAAGAAGTADATGVGAKEVVSQ